MLKTASAVFSFMTIYHRNGRRCECSSFLRCSCSWCVLGGGVTLVILMAIVRNNNLI